MNLHRLHRAAAAFEVCAFIPFDRNISAMFFAHDLFAYLQTRTERDLFRFMSL